MKRRRKLPFDPRAFLSKVNGGRTISDYRKDEIVFSQGDLADAVFYIQKGGIKLTVVSERGKEAVVAILTAGAFFGEGSLAGQPNRMASVSTMSECSIMRLEKGSVLRVLQDEPTFSAVFLPRPLPWTLYGSVLTVTFSPRRLMLVSSTVSRELPL